MVVLALAVVGVAWSVPWSAQANCPSNSLEVGQPVSWYVVREGEEELILVPRVEGKGLTGVVITRVLQSNDAVYELIERTGEGDTVDRSFFETFDPDFVTANEQDDG